MLTTPNNNTWKSLAEFMKLCGFIVLIKKSAFILLNHLISCWGALLGLMLCLILNDLDCFSHCDHLIQISCLKFLINVLTISLAYILDITCIGKVSQLDFMSTIKPLPQSLHSSVRSGIVLFDLTRVIEELVFNSLDAAATKVGISFLGLIEW